MCTELPHYLCQVMYTKHYIYFSTSWEEASSTLHIPVTPYSMDRRSNMHTRWTQQSISRIDKLTSCNRCAALFCIMPLPSITLLSLPSAKFPQINPKPQQKLQNSWLNSRTTFPQIHKRNPYRASGMQLAINSYPYYLSVSHPEAGPVESIFSPKVHLTPTIQNISFWLPTES